MPLGPPRYDFGIAVEIDHHRFFAARRYQPHDDAFAISGVDDDFLGLRQPSGDRRGVRQLRMEQKLTLSQIQKHDKGDVASACEHDNPSQNEHATLPSARRRRTPGESTRTDSPRHWVAAVRNVRPSGMRVLAKTLIKLQASTQKRHPRRKKRT